MSSLFSTATPLDIHPRLWRFVGGWYRHVGVRGVPSTPHQPPTLAKEADSKHLMQARYALTRRQIHVWREMQMTGCDAARVERIVALGFACAL
jgi:hypothetical protein